MSFVFTVHVRSVKRCALFEERSDEFAHRSEAHEYSDQSESRATIFSFVSFLLYRQKKGKTRREIIIHDLLLLNDDGLDIYQQSHSSSQVHSPSCIFLRKY